MITLSFNGSSHQIDITDTSTELFLFQVFSLTDVEPQFQVFIGLDDPLAFHKHSSLENVHLLPSHHLHLVPSSVPVSQLLSSSSPLSFSPLPYSPNHISNPLSFAQSPEQSQFIRHCFSFLAMRRDYEDSQIQAFILQNTPLQDLLSQLPDDSGIASVIPPPNSSDFLPIVQGVLESIHTDATLSDSLLKILVKYFHKNFKFVKKPKCEHCNGSTSSHGSAQPNMMEQMGRASVVELYQCNSCGKITRFPRYNSIPSIFKAKQGRCGEFTQAFCALARSFKFESRIVFDFKDHLWCEVKGSQEGRWKHVDPCEGKIDKPLLYSIGWKKKYTVVIAIDFDGIVDVTPRYVNNWDSVLMRRKQGIGHNWLGTVINLLNQQRQYTVSLSSEEIRVRSEMKRVERRELEGFCLAVSRGIDGDETKGRMSGN
ncbi:hypothetical protein GEMRC1_003042 [Eukaryota sp. GEM-RC1]